MIVAFLGYLAIHFLIYLIVLRHTRLFRSERAIFLYHFIPAVIMTIAVLGLSIVLSSKDMLTSAVLVISLQGIYSLSFLELWSLAQGSYSISMLICVRTAAQDGKEPDFAALEHIGARKRASRLEGLQRLGLIQRREGIYRLTGVGLIFASFLRLIAWLGDLKETG